MTDREDVVVAVYGVFGLLNRPRIPLDVVHGRESDGFGEGPVHCFFACRNAGQPHDPIQFVFIDFDGGFHMGINMALTDAPQVFSISPPKFRTIESGDTHPWSSPVIPISPQSGVFTNCGSAHTA
jgi:hypothetical protein